MENRHRKKHQNGRERPHFFGFQPPKKFVGSLPPLARWLRASCAEVKNRAKHLVMHSVLSPATEQEGTNVALLKTPLKRPRTTTLQIRLEEEVKLKLETYAQFIEATPSYVMTEALKLLFKKDAEFKHWLEHHPGNSDEQGNEGGLFTKTA